MPTQLPRSPFAPYAGFIDQTNPAASPGGSWNLPPATSEDPAVGGQPYPAPGTGAPGEGFWPTAGRFIRAGLTRGAGGVVAQGVREGLGAGSRATTRRNTPKNMRGGNDPMSDPNQPAPATSPGFSGLDLFSNLFSGQPFNQANWTQFTTRGAPTSGTGSSFERTYGPGGYAPRLAFEARRGEDLSQMGNQAAIGFGSNYTGNTQDAGHDMFATGPGSHTMGRLVDGVIVHVPTGYDARIAGYQGGAAVPGSSSTLSPSFGMSAPGAGERYAAFLAKLGYGVNGAPPAVPTIHGPESTAVFQGPLR